MKIKSLVFAGTLATLLTVSTVIYKFKKIGPCSPELEEKLNKKAAD